MKEMKKLNDEMRHMQEQIAQMQLRMMEREEQQRPSTYEHRDA